MIVYAEKRFKGYLEFFYYLINRDNDNIQERLFEYSYIWYCRAALEHKFNRRFTLQQTKQLIKQELALKTITLKNEKDSQGNSECLPSLTELLRAYNASC